MNKAQEIEKLKTKLKEVEESSQVYLRQAAQARGERDESIKREQDTREKFVHLKEMLSDAKQTIARYEGYLDRVHDSDIARDGLIEITEGDRKRSVPKWRSQIRRVENHREMSSMQHGADRPRTHWTSY